MAADDDDIAALLDQLVSVGSDVVMGYRGELLESHEKAPNGGLVTAADLASERAMLDVLRTARPDDAVISEESGFEPGTTGYTWVLDPLDGTANFARGSENFGVIAGLLYDDTPVAGAMALPAIDLRYQAQRGAGFTRNGERPGTRPVRPVRPLRHATIDHSLLSFADSAAAQHQDRTLAAVLKTARGVRCDHSVRYIADTIDGVLDGFVYHSLGLWDIVGTSVILAEAEIVVTDLNGDPLNLSPRAWRADRLYPAIGAAAGLHQELLAAIR